MEPKKQNDITVVSEFNDYTTLNNRQRQVISTCTPNCCNVAYPFFGLIEETGELAEKMNAVIEWNQDINLLEKSYIQRFLGEIVDMGKRASYIAKGIRHGNMPVPFDTDREKRIDDTNTLQNIAVRNEMGDIKWMADALDFFLFSRVNHANGHMDATSQTTAMINLEKLTMRSYRNEIDGQGDEERRPID